jgi:hypothetical protein
MSATIESGIVARAKAPERLDRGADGREGVLDLVGDATGDLAPRRDARGRCKPTPRRREVVEHAVECRREVGDLAAAPNGDGPRLPPRDLARLVREIREGAAQSSREQHREDERSGNRRAAVREDHPVDGLVARVEGGCVLRGDDGDPPPDAVVDGALGLGDGVGRVGSGSALEANVHRRADVGEHAIELACAKQPDARPVRIASAPRHDAGDPREDTPLHAIVDEVLGVDSEQPLRLLRRENEQRAWVGAEDLTSARDEDELVDTKRAPRLGNELTERDATIFARFEREKGPVDELSRAARPCEDALVGVGLGPHLGGRAPARGGDFVREARCLGCASLLAQPVSEQPCRRADEHAEVEDEPRSELHRCARTTVAQSTPPPDGAGTVTSAVRPPSTWISPTMPTRIVRAIVRPGRSLTRGG